MTPDTLNFYGDTTTYLGFVGVLSSFVVLVVAYRRYWNSPYRR